MAGFKLGWKNYLYTELGDALTQPFGDLTVGTLESLRDGRLATRCTLSATSALGGSATVGLDWQRAGGPSDLVPCGLVGLLNYDVSAPGASVITWTIQLYTDSGLVSFDSIEVFQRPSDDFPQHLWCLLGSTYQVYGARIIVVAEWPEATSGTLDITPGAMWAGPVWAPPDGLDATWWQAPVDGGKMGRSDGGQGYPRRRPRWRSFEGRAVHVPFKHAFGDDTDPSLLDIQQLLYRVGTTGIIALFPQTKDATGAPSLHRIHRLGIHGHFAETGRLEHLGSDLFQWTQARVDELL